MGVLELIGLFWVILSTGMVTAVTLIAAAWSITLGVKVALRRYRIGEEMERPLDVSEGERARR